MLLPSILFVLWVIILLVFRKVKIPFFVFLFGSIGLFGFLMFLGLDFVEKYLEYLVTWAVGLIGQITGLYKAFPEYSMITAYHQTQAVSFFVDYECSGFIETLVYVCLLMFYPVYRFGSKLILVMIGVIYIFIANVIRVFFICMITKFFGSQLFFISHTILARVIFFFFMVVIYYVVFTRPHILKQKVGNMSYGK